MQELIRRIQRAYSKIWFSCHIEHRTHANNPGFTERESVRCRH